MLAGNWYFVPPNENAVAFLCIREARVVMVSEDLDGLPPASQPLCYLFHVGLDPARERGVVG
jgi:hypothetical protein